MPKGAVCLTCSNSNSFHKSSRRIDREEENNRAKAFVRTERECTSIHKRTHITTGWCSIHYNFFNLAVDTSNSYALHGHAGYCKNLACHWLAISMRVYTCDNVRVTLWEGQKPTSVCSIDTGLDPQWLSTNVSSSKCGQYAVVVPSWNRERSNDLTLDPQRCITLPACYPRVRHPTTTGTPSDR